MASAAGCSTSGTIGDAEGLGTSAPPGEDWSLATGIQVPDSSSLTTGSTSGLGLEVSKTVCFKNFVIHLISLFSCFIFNLPLPLV